jgi:hypothetical protein
MTLWDPWKAMAVAFGAGVVVTFAPAGLVLWVAMCFLMGR